MPRQILAYVFTALALLGCETVQTTERGAVGVDRTQHMMISAAQINVAAAQSYKQTIQEASAKGVLNRDANQVNRVRAVANRLIPAAGVFRADSLKWRLGSQRHYRRRRSTPGACPAAKLPCTPA